VFRQQHSHDACNSRSCINLSHTVAQIKHQPKIKSEKVLRVAKGVVTNRPAAARHFCHGTALVLHQKLRMASASRHHLLRACVEKSGLLRNRLATRGTCKPRHGHVSSVPSHSKQNSSSYLCACKRELLQRAAAAAGAYHQCPLVIAPHSLRQGSVLSSHCMQRYAERTTVLLSVIMWSP
jgi:hypothetical protein